MGLFDRKYCDICGDKIGLLGNRKLEDGNLCKNCAAKLSPWFSDRRQSTVAQIREQLSYREANRAEVEAFRVTHTLGGGSTKVYLDRDAGKFMVTSASDFGRANPDVLSLDQVTSCHLSVPESKTEEKLKNAEGKMVSYSPPRYKYSYNFDFKIYVDHPYFDDISFRLNPRAVETGRNPIGDNYRFKQDAVSDILGALAGQPGRTRVVLPYAKEYQEYVDMAADLEAVLTRRARKQETAEVTPSQASSQAPPHMEPRGPMICPNCTAETTPGPDGCCEYCGSKLI